MAHWQTSELGAVRLVRAQQELNEMANTAIDQEVRYALGLEERPPPRRLTLRERLVRWWEDVRHRIAHRICPHDDY